MKTLLNQGNEYEPFIYFFFTLVTLKIYFNLRKKIIRRKRACRRGFLLVMTWKNYAQIQGKDRNIVMNGRVCDQMGRAQTHACKDQASTHNVYHWLAWCCAVVMIIAVLFWIKNLLWACSLLFALFLTTLCWWLWDSHCWFTSSEDVGACHSCFRE